MSTTTRTVDPTEALHEVQQAAGNAELLAACCRHVIRWAQTPDTPELFKASVNRLTARMFEYRDSVASVLPWIPVVGESAPQFSSEAADTMFAAVIAACDRVWAAGFDREWIARMVEPDLRNTGRRLKLEVDEFARRLPPVEVRTPFTDGPIPPDGFRWQDTEFRDLSALPWRLLNFLWNEPDRVASFESLATAVWQDHAIEVDKDVFGGTRKRLNAWLKAQRIPFECRSTKSVAVLKKHDWPTE